MKKEYREAFTEVNEIFKIMPVELLSKIPVKFRKIIAENKAEDYKVEIEEPLNEEKLKVETVVLLGLIYRDFLASPEEREQLQSEDFKELKKIEEQLQQKYDMENIFNKRKKTEEYSADLIVYKEKGFLNKIISIIRGIFKK